jgi:hypothetical protein
MPTASHHQGKILQENKKTSTISRVTSLREATRSLIQIVAPQVVGAATAVKDSASMGK